jgi:hypothetical protein
MSKPSTSTPTATALAKPEPEPLAETIREILATVPDVVEDPTPTMIAAVLHMAGPEEWESLFAAESFKDLNGKRLQVNAFRASPSQYEGRLGVFLILDAVDLASGEARIVTCGSEMAMAQILNAWHRGRLPIQVEVFKKETPTKRGFYPMRFKYLGDGLQAPVGDPGQVVSEQ